MMYLRILIAYPLKWIGGIFLFPMMFFMYIAGMIAGPYADEIGVKWE